MEAEKIGMKQKIFWSREFDDLQELKSQ
jgi:hypothetical protein